MRFAGLVVSVLAAVAAAPSAASAESTTWFNSSPITFSGNNVPGPGSPNPSSLVVSGHEGPITDLNLNVNAVDAGRLVDLNLLLVSPSGESEVAKLFNCNDNGEVNNFVLRFDQQAATELPFNGQGACVDGTSYRPSKCLCHDTPWWSSIPGYPHSSNFDNFNNENANGVWRLYAYRHTCAEDCPETDQIEAGWSLEIETGPFNLDVPAGTASVGPASPYPSTHLTGGHTGLITDLDVYLNGVYHSHPDDLDIMLEKVGGPAVMLMSDACGSFDVAAYGWLWNDEAPGVMANDGSTNICATTAHRPTDHNPGDSLPAPAPPGPYATSLSAFDLVDPNGQWRLWVADDTSGDEGFVTHPFELRLSLRPRAATAFVEATAITGEGERATLTVRRSGPASYAEGSVLVSTVAGSATEGDFAPTSEPLSFAAGQTERTIEIAVADDAEAEDTESFTVSLSSPSGDTRVVAPETATVVIPSSDQGSAKDTTPPEDDASTDTTPPETSITKAPRRKIEKPRARIGFSSDDPGADFQCKLDRGPFAPCESPSRLTRLRPGPHRFEVRAVDLAGNIDATPAIAKWKVRRS